MLRSLLQLQWEILSIFIQSVIPDVRNVHTFGYVPYKLEHNCYFSLHVYVESQTQGRI